jgi:hypothetical protein
LREEEAETHLGRELVDLFEGYGSVRLGIADSLIGGDEGRLVFVVNVRNPLLKVKFFSLGRAFSAGAW